MRTNFFFGTMRIGRAIALAFGLAMIFVLLLLFGLQWATTKPAHAATTFTVNKTGDAPDRKIGDGKCDSSRKRGKQCTLRAAIEEANATAGADTINFKIGGKASVKTISPASPLPTITGPVTIDGYTQPGASANTLSQGNNAVLKVELNGANAGTGASGLTIDADDSTIRGLVINSFDPNSLESSAVFIGSGATGNEVTGNFIGTNALGTQDLGNGFAGVDIFGDNNTVGGTSPAARNVISGNKNNGVRISGLLGSGTGNKVEGNFIGTDKTGTVTDPDGISLSGDELGNSGTGVLIDFLAHDNTIGGTASGAGNIISGNGSEGVAIFSSSEANSVEGNFIGTTADGSGDLGNNGRGIRIGSASNNSIGAPDDPSDGLTNAANTIAYNGSDGIVVDGNSAGNRILSNRIFENGGVGSGVGIDLQGNNDVTPNDPDDPDTGPNNLQNFPELDPVPPGATTISGTLNSTPSTAATSQTFTIQCFLTEAGGDPSGHGEGSVLLGQTTVTTNTDGDATFTCPSIRGLVHPNSVSATATNTTTGDTSEFSENELVPIGP